MSKAATSKAGKTKPMKETKGKTLATEKQPATLVEIVPGKFNENDWNMMLDIDDNQDFVWELIDEVLDISLKAITDNYLEKQKIPYNINEARKAMLHIIDWHFLSNDKNDDLTEIWLEDDEPESCIIDSWAQGYVQSVVKSPETSKQVSEINQDTDLLSSGRGQGAGPSTFEFLKTLSKLDPGSTTTSSAAGNLSKNSQATQQLDQQVKSKVAATKAKIEQQQSKSSSSSSKKNIDRMKISNSSNVYSQISNNDTTISMASNASVAKTSSNKLDDSSKQSGVKQQASKESNLLEFEEENGEEYDPYGLNELKENKSVTSSEIKRLEEPISKAPLACQSLLKSILNRNTAIREVEIDSTGQIKSISKFDFDKLASNNVKPRFSIINDPKSTSTAAYDPTKKGRNDVKVQLNYIEDVKNNAIDEEQEIMLEPASGVVFKMVNATRTGPKRTFVASKQQLILEKSEPMLRPIKDFSHFDGLARSSIEEIIGNPSVIKPPPKFKPIPPINSNSSTTVN